MGTDIGLASEQLSETDAIAAFPYYSWHHTILVPRGHPLAELPEVTLRRTQCLAVDHLSNRSDGASQNERGICLRRYRA